MQGNECDDGARHHAYLELVVSILRPELEKLISDLKVPVARLCAEQGKSRLLSTGQPEDIIASMVVALTETLNGKSLTKRRKAAQILQQIFLNTFSWYRGLLQSTVPNELRPAISVLLDAVLTSDELIRKYSLIALSVVPPGSEWGHRIAKRIGAILSNSDPTVVEIGLTALRRHDPDARSLALLPLIGLIQHRDPSLAEEAVELLTDLEEEAADAVPDLADSIRKGKTTALRTASAKALSRIDPTGASVSRSLVTVAARQELLSALKDLGPDTRSYRMTLTREWRRSSKLANLSTPKRKTEWDDLYRLHDEMKQANPACTDREILVAYRKRFKGAKGKRWTEPSDRTLKNYRNRQNRLRSETDEHGY